MKTNVISMLKPAPEPMEVSDETYRVRRAVKRGWPVTDHWQRTVRTFREVYGSSWRLQAEARFGLKPGQLRSAIDRGLTHDVICGLDETLLMVMDEASNRLAARIERMREMRRDVSGARDRRIRAKIWSDADITWNEIFTGHSAEADIRAQFGHLIEQEDARMPT